MKLTKIINFFLQLYKEILCFLKKLRIVKYFFLINFLLLLGLAVNRVSYYFYNKMQFFVMVFLFILLFLFIIIWWKDLIYGTHIYGLFMNFFQNIRNVLMQYGLSLTKILLLIGFFLNVTRMLYIFIKYDVVLFFISCPFNSVYAIKHMMFYVLLVILVLMFFLFLKKKIRFLDLVFFMVFLLNFFILNFIIAFYGTRTAFVPVANFLPFIVLKHDFMNAERVVYILMLLQHVNLPLTTIYSIFQFLIVLKSIQEIEENFINLNFDSIPGAKPMPSSVTETLSELEKFSVPFGLLSLFIVFIFQFLYFLSSLKSLSLQKFIEDPTPSYSFTIMILLILTSLSLKNNRLVQLYFGVAQPKVFESDYTYSDSVFSKFLTVFFQVKEKGISGIEKEDLDNLIDGLCQKRLLVQEPEDSKFVKWFEWLVSFFI